MPLNIKHKYVTFHRYLSPWHLQINEISSKGIKTIIDHTINHSDWNSFINQAINNSKNHFDGTAYVLHVALEHEPVLFHHLKHHVVLKVLDKVQHALSQSEGGQVPLRWVQGVHLGSLVPDPYTVKNKDHAARSTIDVQNWMTLSYKEVIFSS